jgi:hypothetical protein
MQYLSFFVQTFFESSKVATHALFTFALICDSLSDEEQASYQKYIYIFIPSIFVGLFYNQQKKTELKR